MTVFKDAFVREVSEIMNVRSIRNNRNIPMFVYDDHRTALIPIWKAMQDKIFLKPPLLVRFDAHNDFQETKDNWDEEETNNLDDVLVLANNLRSDDGGWVKAVVELGLVSNVITFFLEEILNDKIEEYDDHKYNQHTLLWFKRISDELNVKDGLLCDSTFVNSSKKTKGLWEKLNWDPTTGWGEQQEIWLDLDFDFAIHKLKDGFSPMPWREIDFEDEFDDSTYRCCNSLNLLRYTILKSKLITFATEPKFCYGIDNVAHIGFFLQEIFKKAGLRFRL